MKKGIITIDYSNRIVDRLAIIMHDLFHLYETDGYYPIIKNTTGEVVGAFVRVQGPNTIIRFLEIITDYRGKKNMRKIEIDY